MTSSIPAASSMAAPGDSAAVIRNLAVAHWLGRCLHAVAELGVADAMSDELQSVEVLASKTGTHPDALNRVLRALAGAGVFEDHGRRYRHSPASQFLRRDHPQSQDGAVRFMAADYHWAAWGALPQAVRTGRTAFDGIYGCNSFEYFLTHPEDARVFDRAMTANMRSDNTAVASAYDFSRFACIADVGGGEGHLLRTVLAAAPRSTGVLCDLPPVVENARRIRSERLEFRGVDFFNDDLPAADAYVLMRELHDWSDEDSVRVLRNLRRAAPAQAKLLIIERLLAEGPGMAIAKLTDIEMLVLTGGRERTLRDFQELLARGGFRLTRQVATQTVMTILEAEPVQD